MVFFLERRAYIMKLLYDSGRYECGYCKMGNMPHTLNEHDLSVANGSRIDKVFNRPPQYQQPLRAPQGGLRAMRKRGEF